MKVVAGLFGGFLLAVIGALLAAVTLAASPERAGPWAAIAFFAFWVVGLLMALMAKSAPKAWRRLLITTGILSFLLPISGIVYTGSFMATHVDPNAQHAGAQAAGAAIGGGLLTGVLGFVGFFLGVVFLIIGLLIGRDKQVIYMQAPPNPDTPGATKH